jgi:hypothetical protein
MLEIPHPSASAQSIGTLQIGHTGPSLALISVASRFARSPRSGKVAGAYRKLTVLRQAKGLEAAAPELPTGPFQVIVADPPWQYETGNSLP